MRQLSGIFRHPWLVPLIAPVVLIVLVAVSRICYPFDVGQYEANSWRPGALLLEGSNPYSMSLATNPPFTAAPYGPLFYFCVGLGGALFGEQFVFVRSLSFLALVLIILSLIVLLRRVHVPPLGVAVASALFVSQFSVQVWIGVARPDLLALAAASAALATALVRPGDASAVRASTGGLLAAAAMLFRQTSLVAIVVIVAWYVVHRRYQLAAIAAASAVAPVTAVLAFLSTSGNAVQQLLFSQGAVALQWENTIVQLRALGAAPSSWLLVAAVAAGVAAWIRKPPNAGQDWPFLMLSAGYLGVAVAVAVVTGARAGANINYWLEPAFAACLVAGVASQALLRLRGANSLRLALALAAILAVAAGATGARIARGETLRWQSEQYFRDVVASIRDNTPPHEAVFSTYPELAVYADRRYYFNDFVQYDGRSPALAAVYEREIARQSLSAIVTGDVNPPKGYCARPVADVPVGKVYVVYVHVRCPHSAQVRR